MFCIWVPSPLFAFLFYRLSLTLSNPLYSPILFSYYLPFLSVPTPSFHFPIWSSSSAVLPGDPINSPWLSCHLLCMLMTPQASPLSWLCPVAFFYLSFASQMWPPAHQMRSTWTRCTGVLHKTVYFWYFVPKHLFLTGFLLRWPVSLFSPTPHLEFGRALHSCFSLFTQSLKK